MNTKQKLTQLIESLVKKELRNLLNEGASDILYHFTWADKLYNILKTDTFQLTPSVAENPDFGFNKGKFYYMSTTRSKMSGFKYGTVKLLLDGRKLKQNYKITQVNYWNTDKYSEQEDRIISNNDIINNFSKYILEIHTYGLEDWYKLKDLINIIKDSNIQFFYYNNEKDFLKQKNSIDINTIKFNNKKAGYNYISNKQLDYYDYRFACLLSYKDDKNFNQIKKFIIDNNHSLEKFIDSCNQFKINYSNKIYFNDFEMIETFKVDFHNMKNYTIDKTKQNFNRFIIKLFINDLINNKINSFKEYINYKKFIGLKKIDYFKEELINYIITEKQKNMNEDILHYFKYYMTINDFEYNHGYESKELLSIFNKYFTIIIDIFKKQILKSNNFVSEIFYIEFRIEEEIPNIKNLKLSNELNITDSYNDVEYYDKNFQYIINDLIHQNRTIENKARELQDEYNKQFYNN